MSDKARKEFGDIYDKWVDKIYRFIFLKVGTQETAQDLTSEVFTKAWHSFRARAAKNNPHGDIKNVSAFLYQIARNLIADHYRKGAQARFVSTEDIAVADTGQNLEAKMAVVSEIEQVKRAMGELKDEYREVLVWYYLDELKAPEIAKITGKSEEAVRVTISRALQALREQLL